MVSFPNCKINLGLNILKKRSDGYHDIETLFYPVDLKDALEIIKLEAGGQHAEVTFTQSGLEIHGDVQSNLCVKAFHLLKKDFLNIPPIHIHLHKMIPMGAGLGGGSADGAFCLQQINQLCNLHLTQEILIKYALELGSDCPFFILNKPAFATSRGEYLEAIEINLSSYQMVIVNPNIHISTGLAFSETIPNIPSRSIREIIQLPIQKWNGLLVNDFEKTVFPLFPQIAEIKKELYKQGALYASLSGSGSSIFGIFEKSNQPQFSFDPSFQIFRI